MKHELATLKSQAEAKALSQSLHDHTQALFCIAESPEGFTIVFDDEKGFHSGLNYKQQFVKGWMAARKQAVSLDQSLIPESRRAFLLRLNPLTAESLAQRRSNLPRWIAQEKARITEAREKLVERVSSRKKSIRPGR